MSTITAGETYVVQLRVKDYKDTWSVPVSKYISGSSSYVNPIADFVFNLQQISKYNTSLVATNTSYDPKNAPITNYSWKISKDGTQIKTYSFNTFQQPTIDFLSYGIGTYSYELIVTNNQGLKSTPYTRFLTVVDDEDAPEVEITPQNGNWSTTTNKHTASIKLTDTDSKLKSYQYALTKSSTPPSSGWTGTVN